MFVVVTVFDTPSDMENIFSKVSNNRTEYDRSSVEMCLGSGEVLFDDPDAKFPWALCPVVSGEHEIFGIGRFVIFFVLTSRQREKYMEKNEKQVKLDQIASGMCTTRCP